MPQLKIWAPAYRSLSPPVPSACSASRSDFLPLKTETEGSIVGGKPRLEMGSFEVKVCSTKRAEGMSREGVWRVDEEYYVKYKVPDLSISDMVKMRMDAESTAIQDPNISTLVLGSFQIQLHRKLRGLTGLEQLKITSWMRSGKYATKGKSPSTDALQHSPRGSGRNTERTW